MKILGIPLAKMVWPVALVAAFFVGRGSAPRSDDPEAALRDPAAAGPKSETRAAVEGTVPERRGSRPAPIRMAMHPEYHL